MALAVSTCYSVACDVCRALLHDEETGGIPHFDTPGEAHAAARAERWTVLSDGRLVCPRDDSNHQAELDALMPPEPVIVPDGQLTLDAADGSSGR